MSATHQKDYAILDRPDILNVLFHPRKDTKRESDAAAIQHLMIPVSDDSEIGVSAHMGENHYPTILFFHGNGEIASDYDELGPIYNNIGINFIVADYRGYGRSTGHPTVTGMMSDCHTILIFVLNWLRQKTYTGPLFIMGRSLGSASAIELASCHPKDISGLIVESGFAFAGPLLRLLGADLSRIGFRDNSGFDNINKIGKINKPTLIIHAEFDHIIPYSDGEALYNASPAVNKRLLKIPGANHNDIFMRGLPMYMEAVKTLLGESAA